MLMDTNVIRWKRISYDMMIAPTKKIFLLVSLLFRTNLTCKLIKILFKFNFFPLLLIFIPLRKSLNYSWEHFNMSMPTVYLLNNNEINFRQLLLGTHFLWWIFKIRRFTRELKRNTWRKKVYTRHGNTYAYWFAHRFSIKSLIYFITNREP